MYISKMVLENFRSFRGKQTLYFKKGINFFVGNNNCGKTTIFKAIEFLQSAKNKNEFITLGKENENVSVEVILSGDDIKEIVEQQDKKRYQSHVYEANGTYNIRLLRSSEVTKIIQNNREKTLDIKNVRTWNSETNQFENPSGVDSVIKVLFDAQFVYSDMKNEEYQDFGKTKIVGKLVNAITKDFQNSKLFLELKKAHEKAFGDSGLKTAFNETEESIQSIMREQYGDAKVEFDFKLPDMDNFLKQGSILLTENGITTDVSEKGTGMQRALAMSLIQVYSNIVNEDNSKQLLFFIDEPETFLHPKAQQKVIKAFKNISEETQVFITTHSPYLLKEFNNKNHDIKIFTNHSDNKVIESHEINNFPYSPTWGEINYFAFEMVNIELLNELYGHLQEKSGNFRQKQFDQFLESKGINKNVKYKRQNKNGHVYEIDHTLPTYVRNIIHHPENTLNKSFTDKQLKEAIDALIIVNNKMNDIHENFS